MEYTNLPLELSAILQNLRERGLAISDEESATAFLEHVSYFRFAAYLRPLQISEKDKRFKDNATFEKAIALYRFDEKLRNILFSAIQKIEISLRAKIINRFSLAHRAFWFMDTTLAVNQHKYIDNLGALEQELQRSKDDFIKEHYAKYGKDAFPPAWKLLDLTSFGCLTKLFFNFSDISIKKEIARSYGVPQHEILESWMKAINALRNSCAHHGRVWNRVMPVMPQMPTRMRTEWISIIPQPANRFYHVFCCVAYWLNAVAPDNTLTPDFKALLEKYPNVDTTAMGFPEHWEKEPLWNI